VEVASTDSAQPIEPQQPEKRLEPQPSSREPVREAADADTDVPAPFEEPAASDRSEPDGRAAVVAEATGDTEPVEVAPAPAANSPSDESERTEPRVLLSSLTFVFVENSWTEITDARGRILYGLQREGTRRELAGVPPFAIFLGNAGGVEIFLDGSSYTISPEVRRGNTARFQIEPAINP
jgi:cytoskeleton protein RodZ